MEHRPPKRTFGWVWFSDRRLPFDIRSQRSSRRAQRRIGQLRVKLTSHESLGECHHDAVAKAKTNTIAAVRMNAIQVKADIEAGSIPNPHHLIIELWRRVDELQSRIAELERQAIDRNSN